MPELPEIVAHGERLTRDFAGAELAAFRPLHLTALKTYNPRPDAVVGRVLRRVASRGKHLLIEFDSDFTFVVHLMQGGRLRPDAKRSAKPRGGMARWEFADEGGALLLTEAGTERKAGVWLVHGEPEAAEPLAGLGPEASTVSRAELHDRLAATSGRLHGWLRKQGNVAGVGRLLANEILHTAQLSPFATSTKLNSDEIDRLHTAMHDVIAAATEHERTLDEIGKSIDRPNRVHHRVGFDCPVCGDEVRSVEYRRYTVAYCPSCQTGGKVLADNTTSRFLK